MSKIIAENVNVYYGSKQALFDVSINIAEKEVTALIGPSGCQRETEVQRFGALAQSFP